MQERLEHLDKSDLAMVAKQQLVGLDMASSCITAVGLHSVILWMCIQRMRKTGICGSFRVASNNPSGKRQRL